MVPVGGWMEGGLIACVGVGGTGKTTKAIIEQRTKAADLIRRGLPGICVTMDCGGSASYVREPRTSNVDEVIYDVWTRRIHPKVFTPPRRCADRWCRHGMDKKNPRPIGCASLARDRFWEKVCKLGGVCVVVDDVQAISEKGLGSGNFTHVDDELARLAIMFRHGSRGPNYLWLCAQRPVYIPPALRHAVRRWEIFRLDAGPDAERVHDWYGCGGRCGTPSRPACKLAPSVTTAFRFADPKAGRGGDHVSIDRSF